MQNEVTALLNNDSLEDSVTEGSIQKFYGGLPENLNTIKTPVKKMLTAFGSTYICEKPFSIMNFSKKQSLFEAH
jgi:hypothetical protein